MSYIKKGDLNVRENLKILVDTREQETPQSEQRLSSLGFQYQRKKLDSGDYSAELLTLDNEIVDFSNMFVVERKMNIDELANCLTRERERFVREFDRLEEKNTKCYLLIENATWEKIYKGEYRSLIKPQALVANIFTLMARYDINLQFCSSKMSGKIIGEMLYREALEWAKNNGMIGEKANG